MAFFYAPAIQIMVERAYSVTPVRQPVSVRVRDGISNLRLNFQVGTSMSFRHISSFVIICSSSLLLVPREGCAS